MNRPLQGVLLEHQNARASCCRWIVLNNHCGTYARQNLLNEYIIICQLIIAVVRNVDRATSDQSLNLNKGIAHSFDPESIYSAASLAPLLRFLRDAFARASTGPRNFPV